MIDLYTDITKFNKDGINYYFIKLIGQIKKNKYLETTFINSISFYLSNNLELNLIRE